MSCAHDWHLENCSAVEGAMNPDSRGPKFSIPVYQIASCEGNESTARVHQPAAVTRHLAFNNMPHIPVLNLADSSCHANSSHVPFNPADQQVNTRSPTLAHARHHGIADARYPTHG